MKVIASGLRFPEGPVPLADGSVLFVEMAAERLCRATADGRVEVVADLGGGPNGAAVGPDGRIYVCNNGGYRFIEQGGELVPAGSAPSPGWIEAVDSESGRSERIYDACDGESFGHPNDLVFDRRGGFYFTDTGKMTPAGVAWGSVYYATADGAHIHRVAGMLLGPNGIGLSPDESILYVAETPTARLWAWEVESPGQLRRFERPGVRHGGRFISGSPGFARYDSLAVTASGHVVVGVLHDGGLDEIWPDGSHARHHPLPCTGVTNVAFGGEERRTAYVTYGAAGTLAAFEWHEPGLELAFNM
jgi:gluconolactonase